MTATAPISVARIARALTYLVIVALIILLLGFFLSSSAPIARSRTRAQHDRVVRPAGQQVFAISWRNPDVEQRHFDLDTYAAAVLEARDVVAAITGARAVH